MGADLLPGEELVARLHRHWICLAVALWPLLLVAVAAALLDVAGPVPGDVRILGTLVAGALCGALAIAAWVRWVSVRYTLTDRRVIVERGILTRRTKVIPLDRVQDVATLQSLAGRVLGYGTLEIAAAASGGTASLEDVPGPGAMRDEVFELAGRLRAPLDAVR